MGFRGTVQIPANCPGRVYFVQYVLPSRASIACFTSGAACFRVSAPWGVDGGWPYPDGSNVSTARTQAGSEDIQTVDSPAQRNISDLEKKLARVCINDEFVTYAAFEDAKGDLTSLGWMHWKFSATAFRDNGRCPPTHTTPNCDRWTVNGRGTKVADNFTQGSVGPRPLVRAGTVTLSVSDCSESDCPAQSSAAPPSGGSEPRPSQPPENTP
jgi:hypothetical protein